MKEGKYCVGTGDYFVPNSRTSDSTGVFAACDILYTPHPLLCPDSRVYALVYTNVHAAVRQTNTIQPQCISKKGGILFVCFVLFSNSVQRQEGEPMRTWRNMPWLKGEKGYNNGLWF